MPGIDEPILPIIRAIELVLTVGGFALSSFALVRYPNPRNPPRFTWTWKMKDCFLDKGFTLFLVGTESMGLAVLMGMFLAR